MPRVAPETSGAVRGDIRPHAPRKRRNERGPALGFLTPSIIGLTVFILLPTILAIITSFFNWPTFGEITFAGIENYLALFKPGSNFVPALINTIVFTLVIIPANLVLTLGLAFWVATSRFKAFYRVLFFLPVVTPSVATSIIWKMLYQPGGLLDSIVRSLGFEMPNLLASQSTALVAVSVVVLWNGLGYNTLIFSAAIEQLPDAVLDAAKIDGAGFWNLLFRIKIPLITPSIFFAMIVTMIQAFQIFNQPYVMTAGGPGTATITVVMDIYYTAFQRGALGAASAPAMILFVLIMIVTMVQWRGQRRWVNYE